MGCKKSPFYNLFLSIYKLVSFDKGDSIRTLAERQIGRGKKALHEKFNTFFPCNKKCQHKTFF